MADDPAPPEFSGNPRLPWILFAVAATVALVATAGFVFLLTRSTEGPVDVLRAFYRAASEGDCPTTHALLSPGYQREFALDEWCEFLETEDVPPTFDVEDVSLAGDVATVRVDEGGGIGGLFTLERDADGDGWRIRFIVRGERVDDQGVPVEGSVGS